MAQMSGFVGNVGFGIRELLSTETKMHCADLTIPGFFYDSINLTMLPPITNNFNFTSDFGIRVFSSGCMYYSEDNGIWQVDGMEILPDTTVDLAHCITHHLTSFAGGFIVLPPAIDFNKIWANASFAQNPTIYSAIIGLTSLLIIGSIISHLFDRRDKRKMKLTNLPDNSFCDTYFYEIIVFTGSRQGASTKSNVYFFIKFNQFIIRIKKKFKGKNGFKWRSRRI